MAPVVPASNALDIIFTPGSTGQPNEISNLTGGFLGPEVNWMDLAGPVSTYPP